MFHVGDVSVKAKKLTEVTYKSMMKAIEILNKMLGFNATEKTELKIIGEQPLFTDDEDGGE
jgi:hypothetical protein